jgi:hypothetical protein
VAQLKLALADRFGALWYCDPDFFPIQRQDELDAARERWHEVVADTDAFEAITATLGLDPGGDLGDDQVLAVYRAWKVLNATALDPVGNGRYRFDYLAQPVAGGTEGTRTAGFISERGEITIEQQASAGEPMCPICLAAGTAVETPGGPVAVERLRVGDPVWTLDTVGRRVEATVIALGSTPAPADHEVIRLVLTDGRSATASPGHPLADGRTLGSLRVGDLIDGVAVASLQRLAYAGAGTHDIVVSGPTGLYLVDGIALASTLR